MPTAAASYPSTPERPSPLGNWYDEGICSRTETPAVMSPIHEDSNNNVRPTADEDTDDELVATMKPSSADNKRAAVKPPSLVLPHLVAAAAQQKQSPLQPLPHSKSKHNGSCRAAPVPIAPVGDVALQPSLPSLFIPPAHHHHQQQQVHNFTQQSSCVGLSFGKNTRVSMFPLAPPPTRLRDLFRNGRHFTCDTRFFTAMRRWYSSGVEKWGSVMQSCPMPPYHNSPYAHLYPDEFHQWVDKVSGWYQAEVRRRNVPSTVVDYDDGEHPCSVLKYVVVRSDVNYHPATPLLHNDRRSHHRPNFNNSYSHDIRHAATAARKGLTPNSSFSGNGRRPHYNIPHQQSDDNERSGHHFAKRQHSNCPPAAHVKK